MKKLVSKDLECKENETIDMYYSNGCVYIYLDKEYRVEGCEFELHECNWNGDIATDYKLSIYADETKLKVFVGDTNEQVKCDGNFLLDLAYLIESRAKEMTDSYIGENCRRS